MTIEDPDRDEPQTPPDTRPEDPSPDGPPPPQAPVERGVPRTRAGAAWVGICAAALAAVALIVFMLQNTRRTEVSFLWMHGSLPLALALLIAGVGSVLVAMVFGIVRMTQLRKLARRRP